MISGNYYLYKRHLKKPELLCQLRGSAKNKSSSSKSAQYYYQRSPTFELAAYSPVILIMPLKLEKNYSKAAIYSVMKDQLLAGVGAALNFR